MPEEFIEDMAKWIAMTIHDNKQKKGGKTNEEFQNLYEQPFSFL